MAASQEDPTEQVQALLIALKRVQAVRYADVACITLGVWEQVLSLPAEFLYIWSMPWSTIKGISIFIRYSFFPLMIVSIYGSSDLVTHSDSFCKNWTVFSIFWAFFIYVSMHWLVLQRVHAHYARNKKLLWALVSLWAVSCCAALTGLIAALAEVIPKLRFEPTVRLCISQNPSWQPAIYCSFLILEVPLLILIIHKYRSDIQYTFHSGIVNTLIQDGVIFFLVTFSAIAWHVLFELLVAPVYTSIPRHWSIMALSICAFRLVTNLKKAVERGRQTSEFQVMETPNLGSNGVGIGWSGKRRTIGDITASTVAGPSYGLSDFTTTVSEERNHAHGMQGGSTDV